MKIHEYQAKEIFREAGIPVPPGRVATSVAEAIAIAEEISRPVMIKAQVHVGGRGKAGGIKYAENVESAKIWAQRILGMDIKGLQVKKVLVTEATEIATETYLGIILDRVTKKPVIMISGAGGIDIEEVAAKTPEKIHKLTVDPQIGLLPYQARELAFRVFRDITLVRQVADIIMKLYTVFWNVDASLVEINPLVTTPINQVLAIDAKINIDDNGLFRHPEIEALRDPDADIPAEVEARDAGLSFIKLDGSIGCIVNGAGLAMATMDLVKHYGGEPANFLDIGGSSNPDKVLTAMRIILREPSIRAILINIFGGITRCDDVATGIVAAFKELHPTVPVVVRLTGTNEAAARKILKEVELETAPTLDAVVQKAIALARVSEE